MKTKKLTEKDLLAGKLLSYSAAAGAILALGQNADAQIVYTDVDPDSTVMGATGEFGTYDLDINNDGTVDLLIHQANGANWSTWQSVAVQPQNSGAFASEGLYYACGSFATTYYVGLAFDVDDPVSDALTWNTVTSYSYWMAWAGSSASVMCSSGPWSKTTDKFLGVRISLDEGVTFNYGWVRLRVAQDNTFFIVKDYAYEQTAGKAIGAGEGGFSSVKSITNDLDVKVFSIEKSIIISDLDTDNAHADLYNTLGQLVHSSPARAGRTEIQMENEGLYILKLRVGNEVFTKKVIVK